MNPRPTSSTKRRRLALAAGTLLCLACGTASAAAPLALAEAERLALGNDAGAVALLAEAEAFEHLAVAASKLPPPQVRVAAVNFPVEHGGFAGEPMTHAQVGVRQLLPPAAQRHAAGRRESASAQTRRAEVEERARSVRLAVRHAWLDGFLAIRSQRLVAASRSAFADLVDIERSLYAVGSKNQSDVLRAELKSGHLDARLIALAQRQTESQAALARWVGDAAQHGIDAEPPQWPALQDFGALQAALASHPALAAASARIDTSHAAVALAESRLRPAWTLDFGYGYRDGRQPNGLPRSNMVSASAAFSVPMLAGERQQRGISAAQAQYRAALASKDDLLRRLAADLRREHARWLDLGRRLAVYDEDILRKAEAAADAALAAYRSEAGDLAAVVRSQIELLTMQLERLELDAERHRARAELAYLTEPS